jgi:hypothetical protein
MFYDPMSSRPVSFADGEDADLPSSPAPAAVPEPATHSGEDRRRGKRRSGEERRGRPPLSDHPAQVSLRLPTELLEDLCRVAKRRGETSSETHRRWLAVGHAAEKLLCCTPKS